ncbi:MAG TPA: fluoride efflux transporter CrcB [Patescibacteria group bacterium]|nr:fluoride efflux transporter CrcB [Patescibacteria group bacterium]
MNLLLAIFFGGGTGALARHYSVLAAKGMFGEAFPYGTLFVNILGSFLIGVIMETAAQKANFPGPLQALLVTGFLGGFTTFSAFSLDVYKLAHTGHAVSAAAYVAASVFLSLLAVFAGAYLVKGFLA